MRFNTYIATPDFIMLTIGEGKKEKIVGYVFYNRYENNWIWTRQTYVSYGFNTKDDAIQSLTTDYLTTGFDNYTIDTGSVDNRFIEQFMQNEKNKTFADLSKNEKENRKNITKNGKN